MDAKTARLYPSAAFMRSDQDLEHRLEKKLNDVNIFNNHLTTLQKRFFTS